MKILQLATSKQGGAGIAASRLNKGLIKQNIDSRIIERDDFKPFNNNLSFIEKLKRSIDWRLHPRKRLGYFENQLEIYTTPKSLFKNKYLHQIPFCDIINLHWINEFIDYQSFFAKYAGKIPLVWTLHDMNAFLGDCHYADDNDKVQNSKYENHDNYILDYKQSVYNHLIKDNELTIVTPSK